MKKMILLVLLGAFSNVKAQYTITSVCKTCDTLAIRECGVQKFQKLKFNKKKIKADLETVDKLQYYLTKEVDSIFLENADSKMYYIEKNVSVKYEVFDLNYIKITLYTSFDGKILKKGANIENLTTTYCGLQNGYSPSVFDTRIAKLLLKRLKVNYAFLNCGSFFMNYFFNFWNNDLIMAGPKKIEANIIEPYKIAADIW